MAYRMNLIAGDGIGSEPTEASWRIEAWGVGSDGAHVRYDFCGTSGTSEMATAICERLAVAADTTS